MENRIKMDGLWVPPFKETPIWLNNYLLVGGGFKYFFMFIPIWGRFPFWRAYFSKGLKPPISKQPGVFFIDQVGLFVEHFTMMNRSLRMDPSRGEKKATTCTALKWRVRNGTLEKKRSGGWLVNNLTWPMAKTDKTFWDYSTYLVGPNHHLKIWLDSKGSKVVVSMLRGFE